MEASPVKGYKLFRFEKTKADGTTTILPNYYIRYRDLDIDLLLRGQTVDVRIGRFYAALIHLRLSLPQQFPSQFRLR